MPSSRALPQRPIRYAVIEHQERYRVLDQLHGYALSDHTAREAAEDSARELTANPAAAIAAVEALDAAQRGPPARGRRSLPRVGDAWRPPRGGMMGPFSEFSSDRLRTLIAAGHLAQVYSRAGHPYVTTPERYAQLPLSWIHDEGVTYPVADFTLLDRHRPARASLSAHARYAPCELHGISLWRCLLCAPREAYECDWGTCTANRITASHCERCARSNPLRTFPLPPCPAPD
ncbi:hypothetical protein [Streptomyces sp. N35]|uniref:hypothetical protein n=1 Tax=Streptomyces sp. N35 TaxID=2795730 RepID=UPI0018F5E10D|nr:hypothetical protein [Streptomyces sp. N35]